MKSIARLLALMLAAALCLVPVLTALAEEAAPTADPAAVMATVNGDNVTRGEVDTVMENLVNNYAQYGYDTTNPAFLAAVEQYALDYAIQLKLMEQKAVELGYDQFTDEEKAEITAENATQWASIVDMYVTYYGGVNAESTEEEKTAARANILAMLEGLGYTEATMLENAFDAAMFEKVEAEMIKGIEVTEDDILTAYNERVAADKAAYEGNVEQYEYMTQYYGETSYYMPEGYRGVTHILLTVDEDLLENYQTLTARLEEQQDKEENPSPENEPDPEAEPEVPVTQEEVDAAYAAILASVQPTIDEINQKLESGVSFAELVEEYGNDPGMTAEPTKSEGYSVHMDSVIWDPAFVKGAFSVDNVGDVAAPVLGNYGVHIIYYLRDVPAGPVALTDDLKAELQETVLGNLESEQFNSTMESWKAAAEITYSEEVQALLDAAQTDVE